MLSAPLFEPGPSGGFWAQLGQKAIECHRKLKFVFLIPCLSATEQCRESLFIGGSLTMAPDRQVVGGDQATFYAIKHKLSGLPASGPPDLILRSGPGRAGHLRFWRSKGPFPPRIPPEKVGRFAPFVVLGFGEGGA